MQFVKTCDLKPGMRLAKPIYNKIGVLLYERDSKINAQSIESIKNFALIGIYILEPAEPVPPLSDEDIAFEQFQTIALFQLRTCMEQIKDGQPPAGLNDLIQRIILNYGSLDHKLNFTQNLRSSSDFVYKHAISVAILAAMICHTLNMPYETQRTCVTAALLYDIGYLFVPQDILDKGMRINGGDQHIINECRKLGFDKLNTKTGAFLNAETLRIISQTIYITSTALISPDKKISLLTSTKILKVADTFDRMTAMNVDEEPVSEIVAIKHLFEHPDMFEPRVVGALSTSIHILPTGCCVDLSTNEKALVLMDNPDNFMQPLILKFSDNMVYDLRDPKVYHELQIQDIMKTMDNRIAIDESTLKHFYADEHIRKIADRFRKQKAPAKATTATQTASSNQAKPQNRTPVQPQASKPVSNPAPTQASVATPESASKPVKRLKLK